MPATHTTRLNIRKIQPTDYFISDTFNDILDDIDAKVLGLDHLQTALHWTEWEAGLAYTANDVVRWPNMKSHQYAKCLTGGISGATEPGNNVTGSVLTEGSVTWKVMSLTEATDNSAPIMIWLGGEVYSRGDVVIYANALYRAKVNHTASGTFEPDKSKWQEIYASIRLWVMNKFYYEDDTVIVDNIIYKCNADHTSASIFTNAGEVTYWDIVGNLARASEWHSITNYLKDQLITKNGLLYRAVETHTSSGVFTDDTLKWEPVFASIIPWTSNAWYDQDTVVYYDNVLYRCIDPHVSSVNFDYSKWVLLHDPNGFIRDWVGSTHYYQYQLVRYNGNVYRCNTANNDANFTIAKWDLLTDSINDWVGSSYYVVGQYVNYNGILYKCITANNDANFTISKWQKVSGGGIDSWSANTDYIVGDVVVYANKIYQCNTSHTSQSTFTPDASKWTEISACITRIPDWLVSTDYVVGDLVAHDAKIYRCTTAHTSGNMWNSTEEANWEELSPTINEISDWAVSTDYAVGQLVIHNDKLYRCNTAHTSDSTSFNTDIAYWDLISGDGGINPWLSGEPYSQGSMVVYNDKIYICDTAHTSSSTFDPTKWHEVSTNDIALWQTSTDYFVGNIVLKDNQIYRCTTAHTSDSSDFYIDIANWQVLDTKWLSDNWVTATYYSVGEIVLNNGYMYRCTTAHTSSTFSSDISNWSVIISPSIVNNWQANINYFNKQLFEFDGVLYRTNKAFTGANSSDISQNISDIDLVFANIRPWADNTYYVAGSIVYYGGCIYKCNTSHISDEFIKLIAEYNGDGYIRKRRIGDTQWNIDVNDHTFDLGSVCTLEYLDFYHSSNYGEHVNGLVFEVSTDGTTFTNAGSWTYNSSALNSTTRIKFNYTARYVKITSTGFTMYDSTNRDAYISNVKIWSNNSSWDMISNVPFWSANVIYKNGDFCIYNGYIYKCINTNYDSSFDSLKWEKIGEYKYWTTNTSYSIGDIVIYNDKFYKCTTAHTSSSFNSDYSKWTPTDKNCFIYAWASNTPYYLSEVVSYSGSLYRCIVPNLSTTLEPPTDAIIYVSTTNVIDVDDTTTIPYTETIDLSSVYKITDIQYSEVTTDMTFTYTIEISDDNTTFTQWSGDNTDARYIRLTVDSVNIASGATNPSAYLDNFTVYGDNIKWERLISGESGNLIYATNSDIDNLFI